MNHANGQFFIESTLLVTFSLNSSGSFAEQWEYIVFVPGVKDEIHF